MIRKTLLKLIPLCCLIGCNTAIADFFENYDLHTMNYGLSPISIPDTVGATSEWTDNSGVYYETSYSDALGASIVLTFNGSLLGDGKTFATNNPGVGIQYKLHLYSTDGLTPSSDITDMPFRYDMTSHAVTPLITAGNYLHVYYRLVRLTEKVPPGEITTLPDVYVAFTNAPEDSAKPGASRLILSGIISQPKMIACNINAPSQIKLAPLYGASLVNGEQGTVDIEPIPLTNCPGAINGISYVIKAVYGNHDATNGVINTQTGTGYANNVFIQLQNNDGSGYTQLGNTINFNYTGSGDYNLPAMKIGYFINNKETVTAGNVQSALEINVNYN